MPKNKIISVKNLSFFYNQKEVFNKLNLDIEENKWTTIIGNNGSGKTTLTQLLIGKLPFKGQIIIDNLDILENKNNEKTIKLININILKEKIDLTNKQIEEIVNNLGIKSLVQNDFSNLNNDEKILIYLVQALIHNPKILLIDNVLDEIEYKYKEKIIKILKKYQKKGMTIIHLSQNIEDTLLGDNIVIIDSGRAEFSGTKKDILSDEKKIKELNLNLPFVIDLSNKLKYYGMVDKLYYNEKELIDAIWK